MYHFVAIVLILITIPAFSFAIAIILPSGGDFGANISLSKLPVEPIEANVSIEIVDNYATISVMQIFRNPNRWNKEGVLNFPLQEGMEVFGFATWDGPQRISGVILEKRRAMKIYDELRARAIDPGILLPSAANIFTAKIVPIPGFGTKRVEIECGGLLEELDDKVSYTLPLAPKNVSGNIELKRFDVSVKILGRADFKNIEVFGISLPIEREGNIARGEVHLRNFTLPSALTIDYDFFENAPALSAFAFPVGDTVYGIAMLKIPSVNGASAEKPTVAIMTDISASVANYKDEISIATEILAQNAQKFSCIAFNDSISKFPQNAPFADEAQLPNLNRFLQNLSTGFGTNLLSALEALYSEIGGKNIFENIVLITDGVPSVGEIGKNEIFSMVDKNKSIPIYIVAIGNDVSAGLLKSIAERTGGAYLRIVPGDDISKALDTKLLPLIERKSNRMKKISVRGAKLLTAYPEKQLFRSGIQGILSFSLVDFHSENAKISLTTDDNKTYESFIVEDSTLSFIGRLWAKHRVEYLIKKIAQEGEKDEWVNEIVALSKKFTFVTPYTAFLAAPRAVLRPRVIQPRDPKIVVDAPNALQVIVELPWGEQISAVQNNDTKLWEARFLVPQHIVEGEYECIITITDASGAQWQQRQKFIVDKTPPQLKVEIVPDNAKAGQTIELRAYAPQDTRTIFAKTPDGKILKLRWNGAVGASTAKWTVPHKMPAGEFLVKITATDFAGNQSEQTAKIVVK